MARYRRDDQQFDLLAGCSRNLDWSWRFLLPESHAGRIREKSRQHSPSALVSSYRHAGLVVTQHEEGKWIALAREGDRGAFAALVELYWHRIHRWLFALTRHAHLAEDLTQDVFVKAWLALPRL